MIKDEQEKQSARSDREYGKYVRIEKSAFFVVATRCGVFVLLTAAGAGALIMR